MSIQNCGVMSGAEESEGSQSKDTAKFAFARHLDCKPHHCI